MKEKVKRKFIFVDESGDPGIPGTSGHFAYNILMLDENDIQFIEKELAYFRFYNESYKELKKYTKNNKMLVEMLRKISMRSNIRTYFLWKKDFTGRIRGVRFRNFILKKSLEKFFNEYIYENSHFDIENMPVFEIVIDRYLDGKNKDVEEINLKRYLNRDNNLPKFNHITMVDSRYTPAIQILDIVSEYFSHIKYSAGNNKIGIKLVEIKK